jgi:hypothetical protein
VHVKNLTSQEWQAFTQRVRDNLRQAETVSARLRQTNTRLQVTSIASSAVTTLVAGITAVQGPVVGQGDPGWRLACVVAAIFGLVSAVCVGLNQQLKLSDRQAQSYQCTGRLKALDAAITTGSRNQEEVAKEYEEIVKTYPEYI